MKLRHPRALVRLLRRPVVILGELLAVAGAGAVGAGLPQVGVASAGRLAALRSRGELVTALVDALSLDHVFTSGWFLLLCLVTAASLTTVVARQLRRLRSEWSRRPREAQFARATLRREFERPARIAPDRLVNGRHVALHTTGRLGLAGSPVFHCGLLLVMLAGAGRALFSVVAAVDVCEGETLPGSAGGWAAQWPALLAESFAARVPVRVESVAPVYYDDGGLRGLTVELELGPAAARAVVAVNQDVEVPGGRLFIGSDFGPAAMIEWQGEHSASLRSASLLSARGDHMFVGRSKGPGDEVAHIRAQEGPGGARPTAVDLRVMSGRGLLHAGTMAVGDTVRLSGGSALTLHGMPYWIRLNGSRDPARGLAYTGFALLFAGVTLMFAVIKVDTCIAVTPGGATEHVVVALRAQRLTPVFRDRFDTLVRREGGAA